MKECGLHLEGNKEDFAGFKMGAEINRICISARVYFVSSLLEDRGEAERLVTRLLAGIPVRNGGHPGPR